MKMSIYSLFLIWHTGTFKRLNNREVVYKCGRGLLNTLKIQMDSECK